MKTRRHKNISKAIYLFQIHSHNLKMLYSRLDSIEVNVLQRTSPSPSALRPVFLLGIPLLAVRPSSSDHLTFLIHTNIYCLPTYSEMSLHCTRTGSKTQKVPTSNKLVKLGRVFQSLCTWVPIDVSRSKDSRRSTWRKFVWSSLIHFLVEFDYQRLGVIVFIS